MTLGQQGEWDLILIALLFQRAVGSQKIWGNQKCFTQIFESKLSRALVSFQWRVVDSGRGSRWVLRRKDLYRISHHEAECPGHCGRWALGLSSVCQFPFLSLGQEEGQELPNALSEVTLIYHFHSFWQGLLNVSRQGCVIISALIALEGLPKPLKSSRWAASALSGCEPSSSNPNPKPHLDLGLPPLHRGPVEGPVRLISCISSFWLELLLHNLGLCSKPQLHKIPPFCTTLQQKPYPRYVRSGLTTDQPNSLCLARQGSKEGLTHWRMLSFNMEGGVFWRMGIRGPRI